MQLRLIYTFLLTLVAINTVKAQKDTITVEDITIITKETPKHLFINLDLSSPLVSLFSDRKGVQGAISYQVNENWLVVGELGIEKNKFTESNWNVDVSGTYGKLGFNKYFVKDIQNPLNGFYYGGRLAFSSFNQKINSYPIRDIYTNHILAYGIKDEAKVNAYWLEVVVGGKVQLNKNFYADFSIHPSILLGGKKQDNIEALVVPGYGRNNGPFNLPFFWGISYQIF